MGVTNKLLRSLGSGTNAFILTKRVVNDDIYKRTRNPMSLGFYLLALARASFQARPLSPLLRRS